MKFEYKCVPVPSSISTGTDGHRKAVEMYEGLINKIAADGWELQQIDTLESRKNGGCLGLGKQDVMQHKIMIFRKPVN